MLDSLRYQDLIEQINRVVENTKPLYFTDFDQSIAYCGFIISIVALIAGIIAAFYSYLGYKYQKQSTEKLEKLVPGQISLYNLAGSLLNTILDLEAIYFGNLNFKEYPLKLILSTATLPDDFIELNKYEKNKRCYDAAMEIKISWRNYNLFISTLLENSEKINTNDDEIKFFANYIIEYSKSQLIYIQKFENILFDEGYMTQKTASKDKISFFLLELFFEYIQIIESLNIKKIDTSRMNFTVDNFSQYTNCPYMSSNIDLNEYLSSEHYNRLSGVSEELASYTSCDISKVYNRMMQGEFNMVDRLYYKEKHLADMDISNFKTSYFTYIEPILLGYKRHEYSLLRMQNNHPYR